MMTRISRRTFLKALGGTAALSVCAGTLAACGSASGSAAASSAAASAPASSAAASAPAEISGSINFYYWDDAQTDSMKQVISLFNADHPKIEVVATLIPSGEYWTKLQTSLPTATGPDVFWMNLTAPNYYNAGLLYDISDRIAADKVDMTVFPQLLKDLYSKDSAVYGIPKDYDGIGLFYNKAIFDEMKVDYPKDGMSWDELLDLAKKTTTKDHYGFAAQNAGNICYQDFIYSNGGRISSADNIGCEINQPAAVEAVQYLHDMMYVSKVSPTYAEQQEMSASDMFIAGQLAMITAGSWKMNPFTAGLSDSLGICTMPVAKVPAITVHGLAYCISAKSASLDASWEFVKFCATKEAQEATVKGAIPAYKGCDQLWADTYSQYDAAKLLEGITYEGSLGNPWWDKGYADANTALKEAMTTIWTEADIDIQSALDQCVKDIEAITKA